MAVSGEGGSNPTYRFANVLVWGFALTIAQARTFMLIYSAKCKPPWSATEIEHKLEDALKDDQHDKPRGYLWGEEFAEDDDDDDNDAARHGFRRKPSTSPRIPASRLSLRILRKGTRRAWRRWSKPEHFRLDCRTDG